MKRSALLLVIFAALVVAGVACRALRPEAGDPMLSRPSDFPAFVDAYFAARYAFSPSQGSGRGLHEYDEQLEDRTRGRIEARIAELKAQAARVALFDRAKLAFDEAIDADALEHAIASELLQLEVIRGWENNPMQYARLPGAAIDGLMKRSFAPGPVRVRAVINRLAQVPRLYGAARANLKTPPKEFTEVAIRQAKGAIRFFEVAVPAWAREVAGGETALLAELNHADALALASARDYADWLEKDLAPRSTGKFALGAELYARQLSADEMVETPIPELLAIGEAQLKKDHDALVAVAARIDPKKSPVEVMKDVTADHPTEEDFVPAIARSLEEVRRFIVEKDLITIPSEVRPTVAETPPYARGGSFASMDTPGAYETKATEAYYYVTPVEKEWDARRKEEQLRFFNKVFIALVDIHEAFPGHYVQFLNSPRFPTKTRKLLSVSTNTEGWAHYAEQMAVDEGFGGADPRYRLAQLAEALIRDCRYLVGIKLHTAGMTVDEGARSCFQEQAFMEAAPAYEEARRGTFNPTYLSYTLGKLEILKLRDEYRQKTGATLKQFHDAFVAQGALPIPLVRRILLEKK